MSDLIVKIDQIYGEIFNKRAKFFVFRRPFSFFSYFRVCEKIIAILLKNESDTRFFYLALGVPAETKSLTLSLKREKGILDFTESHFRPAIAKLQRLQNRTKDFQVQILITNY